MRKKVFLICALALFSLCGCSKQNMIEFIAGQSGKDIDTDAQAIIDEANSAAESQKAQEENDYGNMVYVSFAKNSNLDIKYSHSNDFSGEDAVPDGNMEMFRKGENIYANVSKAIDNKLYNFSEFKIYAVDGDSKKEICTSTESNGVIWTVPSEPESGSFLIMPVGGYEYERLSFSAKCASSDNDDTYTTLPDDSGYFTVDDATHGCNEKDVLINPFADYDVRFIYDDSKYFFVSSEPKNFGTGDVSGEVMFYGKDQQETSVGEYSVTLQRYIDISAATAADRKVLVEKKNDIVQGENETTVKKGSKWEYSNKLRFGDKLKIRTDKEWNELADRKHIKMRSDEPVIEKGYYYYEIEIVRTEDKKFLFDPAEYSDYLNGSIQFRLDGFDVKLDKATLLEPGQRIIAEGTPEDGYYLPPDNKKVITVSNNFNDTKSSIKDLKFIKAENSVVMLLQPEHGGKIRYYINGVEQTSNKVEVRRGTIIEMELEAQNHWKCDNPTVKYLVGESEYQQTDINGESINTAFKEDENYYPDLKVTLNSSIEKRSFNVQTASFTKSGLRYEGALNLLDDSKDLGKTQTTKGIKLTSEGHTYVDNKMIKVTVLKTGENGVDTEIYYIDKENSVDIPIYTSYGQTYYKTVELKISVTDKYVFMPYGALRSGRVSVSFTDNLERNELQSGDLVDGDRRIRVEIIPDATYFVVGRNNNERYYEDMKYSQYDSRIGKIISEHQIKKKYPVRLTESDNYGEFSYTVDGQGVSGTVLLMDGYVLKVTYTVTKPSCAIKAPIFGNKQTNTYTIKVDSKFSSVSEINREFLGIKIVATN